MSTTAGIALRSGDTYQTIYCHWNGHPKTMLPILRENYNTLELVAKLISHGDASFIEAKLEPNPDKPHTFMNYQEDVCVFYHRDRGDNWIECNPVCYTRDELLKPSGFEYIYIFEDGDWNAYTNDGGRIEI